MTSSSDKVLANFALTPQKNLILDKSLVQLISNLWMLRNYTSVQLTKQSLEHVRSLSSEKQQRFLVPLNSLPVDRQSDREYVTCFKTQIKYKFTFTIRVKW